MFVESVRGSRRDWELVSEKSKILEEPPDGLVVCVVLPDGGDAMSAVMVWDTPGERGDWAASTMMPLFESGELAEVQSNPSPVEPIALYLRD